MDQDQKQIAEKAEEFLEAVTATMTDEEKELMDLINQGAQMKDLRGMEDEHVDALYALGYNLYNQGQYDKAETMFRYVCTMAHLNRDYWNALGNCQMMQKDYTDAINTYGYSYALDPDDPWPCIHTARCYLSLGDKEQASAAIELAEKTIELAEGDFTEAKERLAGLKGGLH